MHTSQIEPNQPLQKSATKLPLLVILLLICLTAISLTQAFFLFTTSQKLENVETKLDSMEKEHIEEHEGNYDYNEHHENNTRENSESEKSQVPDDWQTYTSPTLGYSISYPTQFTQQEGDFPAAVKLVFAGETQRPGTELHDGVLIHIAPYELDESAMAFVENSITQSKERGLSEVLDEPKEISINGMNAVTYKARGLGEYIQTVFKDTETGMIYQISIVSSDEYEDLANQVLETFEL